MIIFKLEVFVRIQKAEGANSTVIKMRTLIMSRFKIFFIHMLAVNMFLLAQVPDSSAEQKRYRVYLKNGKLLAGYMVFKSKTDHTIYVVKKNGSRLEIKKDKVSKLESMSNSGQVQKGIFRDNSGYGLGHHKANTRINVKRIFKYRDLLRMDIFELCDISSYVIRNPNKFPTGYAESVDSALKYVRLQEAEERLDRAYERGDSVSAIMEASKEYGEAWVENEIDN